MRQTTFSAVEAIVSRLTNCSIIDGIGSLRAGIDIPPAPNLLFVKKSNSVSYSCNLPKFFFPCSAANCNLLYLFSLSHLSQYPG